MSLEWSLLPSSEAHAAGAQTALVEVELRRLELVRRGHVEAIEKHS